MPTGMNVIINEYMEDSKIITFGNRVVMNKATFNKLDRHLNKKKSLIDKIIGWVKKIIKGGK